MLKLEEYIQKRKKEDEINEFDILKKQENIKLAVDYIFEYFNGYLDKNEMEQEIEIESKKIQKYRESLRFYDKPVQDWLVELFKNYKVKFNLIIQHKVDDPIFPLFTEESEFNKLSYILFSKLSNKYPFLVDNIDMLKSFLKEYNRHVNDNEYTEATYKLAKSEKINKWVDKTKKLYNINLQAFVEYYCDLFSLQSNLWDRCYYLNPIEKKLPFYDVSKSKDLFAISTLYSKISHKPFIKGKKKELIVIILMYYKERIDDNVPEELISKCLADIGEIEIN